MSSKCSPALLLLMAVGIIGCGGDHSPRVTTPDPATLQLSAAQPRLYADGLGQAGVVCGILQLDTTSLEMRWRPTVSRGAQQAELYGLSIGAFTSPQTVQVQSIARDDDTLSVAYTITHPFPAATNLEGPATAKNREDLAITGRVMFLVDAATPDTYFAGDDAVRLNPRLVTNADGYFTPGELLADPGLQVNTFPYQLIVDEARDNRVGLSNAGKADGNFGDNGWGVDEFAAGVTGFDVLAQGQTAENTVELSVTEIASQGGQISLPIALVVKYQDPRAGSAPEEKRINRLPSADMKYRYPHGALDVGWMTASTGQQDHIIEGILSEGRVYSLVRDWDVWSGEASGVDLSEVPNVRVVSAGEAGAPIVEFDIPGVFAGPMTVVSQPGNSGEAMDELLFRGDYEFVGPPAGEYPGLVRARDIVDIEPPAGWGTVRFNLQPDLTPIAGSNTEGSTHQAFTLVVESPVNEPPLIDFSVVLSPINSGNRVIVKATNISDPEMADLDVEIDWNNSGTWTPAGTIVYSGGYPPAQDFTSPMPYTWSGATPDLRSLPVRYSDGTNQVEVMPLLEFEVVDNSNLPPSMKIVALNDPLDSGTQLRLRASNFADPELEDLLIEADWFNDGNWIPAGYIEYQGGYPAEYDMISPDPYFYNGDMPDLRTIPLRYSDAANLVTLDPALVVEVVPVIVPGCMMPPPAKAGMDITTLFGETVQTTMSALGFPGQGISDVAAFSDPLYGGFIIQPQSAVSRSIYHLSATDPPVMTPMTSGSISGYIGGKVIYDLEVDTQNRVFFTARTTTHHSSPPDSLYDFESWAAIPHVMYFDYAGSVVSFFEGQISTQYSVIAMCIGANDEVYLIDRPHTLRRYVRSGPSEYVQDIAGTPFPLDLAPIIGIDRSDGDPDDRNVGDFVQNWHNGAFYILVHTTSGVGLPDVEIHRIECDGTSAANSPLIYNMSNATQPMTIQMDITIDQVDALGNPLPQGDVQFLLAGFDKDPGMPDLWVMNAELEITASHDFDVGDASNRIIAAVSVENWLFTRRGLGDWVGLSGTAPVGWQ